MRRKGAMWVSLIITYVIIALVILFTSQILKMVNKYFNIEPIDRIEQPKKYYEPKIKELKMKLSPISTVSKYQIKSKCMICNFDFEPWKDDATHEISHGYCADCVIPFLKAIYLSTDSIIVKKVRARMQIAIDWSV